MRGHMEQIRFQTPATSHSQTLWLMLRTMKNMRILIGLFVLIQTYSYGQLKIGVINDPDGYTNVREAMSTDAKIISKIFEFTVFEFEPSAENWYKVRLDKNQSGYVHKSRIRELDNCKCKSWGGSKPLYVFPKQGIEICGYLEKRVNEYKCEITETQISNCVTGESLLEISAVDNADLEIKGDKLLITKTKNLPTGQNWSFIKTPIKVWTLDLNESNSKFRESRGLKPPFVTTSESSKLIESVKQQPPTTADKFETIMYKLFVSAISGDKEAELMFRDHRKIFKITLDGYIAEDFGQLSKILDDFKRGE
jgi:hypothetical protein